MKDEGQVKAAYVYNFAKFIRYAEMPNSGPLVLGVLGENPLEASFSKMQGRLAQGRTIQIVQAKQLDLLKEVHILYIGLSEEKRLKRLLTFFEGKAVLTVSSINGFADRGGMIELVTNEGRVDFEINLKAVRESNLDLPYQLLELARRVVE